MGKFKYGIAAVALVGIVGGSMPYITKNSIDNSIKEKQNELLKDGINLNIVDDEGYINSKREIKIQIKDSIKFIDYISESFEIDVEILNKLTNHGEYLENLSLNGSIKNSNIFPKNISVSLTLDELPNDLKQLMRKEPIVNKLIKSLSLQLKIDTSDNIKFVSLNDIIINDEKITAQILQPKMNISKNNYLTSIQNMTLKLKERKENVLIYFDDIKDKLNYRNSFNFDETTTINNIKFNYISTSRHKNNISYSSTDNEIKMNSNSKNDELNMKTDYVMGNSFLRAGNIDAKVDDLALTVGFKGFKEQPIIELLDFKNSQAEVSNILESRLQEIANYGFTINLKSNINNIRNNKATIFTAKNINISLNAKLKRNNLNKDSTSRDIAEKFSVNGLIKMDKKIIDLIKPIQKYNTNIINNVSNFDIKLINGKLFINEHNVI